VRDKLNKLLAQHALTISKIKQEKQHLEQAKASVDTIKQAQSIVQQVAETIQNQAHKQIANVVTSCLQAVFGEDAYEFRIVFDRKRGKTEARLVFVRNGEEIEPTDSAGGGVLDVAAFSLRLACLVLSVPKKRRFLALDEPFKHLSADYRPAVRELLMKLAEEMNMQFLLITHALDLAIGKVVEL